MLSTMFLDNDMKFSVYEIEDIIHSKICSIYFDVPPGPNRNILKGIMRIIEYPKEVVKSIDSGGWSDCKFINKDNRVSCRIS